MVCETAKNSSSAEIVKFPRVDFREALQFTLLPGGIGCTLPLMLHSVEATPSPESNKYPRLVREPIREQRMDRCMTQYRNQISAPRVPPKRSSCPLIFSLQCGHISHLCFIIPETAYFANDWMPSDQESCSSQPWM